MKKTLLLVLLVLQIVYARDVINIGGSLTENTTLLPGKTYALTSDLTTGAYSLTIGHGDTILCGAYTIMHSGTGALTAVGTADSAIIFTSAKDTVGGAPNTTDKTTPFILSYGAGNFTMQYCIVKYYKPAANALYASAIGIYGENTTKDVVIKNSRFYHLYMANTMYINGIVGGSYYAMNMVVNSMILDNIFMDQTDTVSGGYAAAIWTTSADSAISITNCFIAPTNVNGNNIVVEGSAITATIKNCVSVGLTNTFFLMGRSGTSIFNVNNVIVSSGTKASVVGFYVVRVAGTTTANITNVISYNSTGVGYTTFFNSNATINYDYLNEHNITVPSTPSAHYYNINPAFTSLPTTATLAAFSALHRGLVSGSGLQGKGSNTMQALGYDTAIYSSTGELQSAVDTVPIGVLFQMSNFSHISSYGAGKTFYTNTDVEFDITPTPVFDSAVLASALPAGLTLNKNTGTISGNTSVTIGPTSIKVYLWYCDGIDSCYFNIDNILQSAEIVTHPVSDTVQTGTTVSFSITAIGEDRQYAWYRQGVFTGAVADSYSFTTTTATDSDSIQCVVYNLGDTVTSSTARLRVFGIDSTGIAQFTLYHTEEVDSVHIDGVKATLSAAGTDSVRVTPVSPLMVRSAAYTITLFDGGEGYLYPYFMSVFGNVSIENKNYQITISPSL